MSKGEGTLVAAIHDSGFTGYADDNTECAVCKDVCSDQPQVYDKQGQV